MADKNGGEIELDDPETVVETKGNPAQVEDENGEGDESEVSFAIEGESPAPGDDDSFEGKPAPAWVKELRKSNREAQKRLRELEAENAALKPKPALAAKPSLESCEYDEARYESELTRWHEQKRRVEDETSREEAKSQKLKADWDNAVTAYKDEGKTLGVKDFGEAEAEAKDIFSVVQQGIIIKGAHNPAKVIYALGKNPELARKLASQEDHIKFAFAVAQLEGKIVTKTKTPPKPETVIRNGGGSPMTNASEKHLVKLREQAAKSGDYTEVVKYKRELARARH